MPRATCAGEPTSPISSLSELPTLETSAPSPTRRATSGWPVTRAAASNSRIFVA
jgi:hypothetical protein